LIQLLDYNCGFGFWTRILGKVVRLELWIQLLEYNCVFKSTILDEMAPNVYCISDLEFCFKLTHCSGTYNFKNRCINQIVWDSLCIYENWIFGWMSIGYFSACDAVMLVPTVEFWIQLNRLFSLLWNKTCRSNWITYRCLLVKLNCCVYIYITVDPIVMNSYPLPLATALC